MVTFLNLLTHLFKQPSAVIISTLLTIVCILFPMEYIRYKISALQSKEIVVKYKFEYLYELLKK